MNRICVSALALAALAGAANAQQVTFRIVERTGQTVANSSDALLELAVQAMAAPGTMLGGYNFNIITTDAESGGALARAKIMNGGVPNTYFTSSPWSPNSTVGVGGIAGQYSYLAGISSQFNGLINVTGGTFTNNPGVNEIGLVAGAATGSALTSAPGVDTNGDGNPDTAPSDIEFGDMTGVPQNNEVAQITDSSIRTGYFGDGNFIDVYRFRYTVSNFTARQIHFNLSDLGAQTFTQLLFNNGAWGAQNTTVASGGLADVGIDIAVTPTPASVALMGLGGLMVARRRRS